MIRSTRQRAVSGDERRWLKVFGTLNEFQARLFAADKALDLGRGGISRLSALRGLSRATITKGSEEMQGRVRRAVGGREKGEQAGPPLARFLRENRGRNTA